MRVLVLGGTAFVGRAIVEAGILAGWTTTLFHRGRTGSELFPGIERRHGDRAVGDYSSLVPGEWDALIDVTGYVPRHVADAMAAVGDRIGRYVFISSHAVYVQDGATPGAAEDAPRRAPRRDTEVLTNDTYGPAKVACEDDVVARYGQRTTIVRPGKLAGPYDDSDAFTYWVRRAAGGDPIALPGRLTQPVQILDVRDLAQLVVAVVREGRAGAVNAVGPADPVTMADLLATCAQAAGTNPQVVEVPAAGAPALFPLLRPERQWPTQQRSAALARAWGMPATPLAVTAADVLAWDLARGRPPIDRGFTAEQERAVLAEVH